MSDDRFRLASPGVTTTGQTEPYSTSEIFTFYEEGGSLFTREWVAHATSESRSMMPVTPVDWGVSVPRGSGLFSITAGVSPAAVHQFWVGWLADGKVHMEGLAEKQALSSRFVPGELAMAPAVMDGSGTASFYSWRTDPQGTELWKRRFSGAAVTEHRLGAITGRPLFSRVAAIPGVRSPHAVVGWLQGDGAGGVVLGLAIDRGDEASILTSKPITNATALDAQRIGVWASSPERLEVTAVVAREATGYASVRFRKYPDTASGVVTVDGLVVDRGTLVRATVDYSDRTDEPTAHGYFLDKRGRLWSESGATAMRVVRRLVPLDSPLPIVITSGGNYLGVPNAEGGLGFEVLDPRVEPSDMNSLP